MNTHANKTQSVADTTSKKQGGHDATFQFIDNRPEAITQKKLQGAANNSPKAAQTAQIQLMAKTNSFQNQVTIQRAKAISVTKDTNKEYSIEATGDPATFTGGSDAGKHGVDGVESYSAEFSANNQLNILGNKTGKAKKEESNPMNNLLPEYVGGHLLPKEFGGAGNKENVFNQEGGQNSGSWRSFEIAASDVLNKTPPGSEFAYKMKLTGNNLTKD